MRLTGKDIRASRIPAGLGLCPTDARLFAIVNEATRRIIDQQVAWGMYARYRCQAIEAKLVFPRQVASILAIAQDGTPLKSRNQMFEFLGFGMGIQDRNNASCQFIAANTSCLFQEIVGSGPVGVYCDLNDDNAASATPASVLLLGFDDNGNWVRSKDAGVWHDGEIVIANNTTTYGALSTHNWTALTGVQKETTNGDIRLYQYDATTHTQRAIARYEPDETNPSYRVFKIPTNDYEASVASPKTLEVMVSLEFIPIVADTDYCLIGNLAALKDMSSAVVAAEKEPLMQNKMQAIAAGLALAKQALTGEWSRYVGREDSVISVSGTAGPTEDSVLNLI